MHVAVDDGPADTAVAADIDMREDDTGFDFGIGIYAHIGREHAVAHGSAADDAAARYQRIQGSSGATGLGKNKLRRRVLPLMRADRPVLLEQVEHGRDRCDIHIGFVISLKRAYIAPVEGFLAVLIDEVRGINAIIVNHLGEDVVAKIVPRVGSSASFSSTGISTSVLKR